MSHDHRCTCVNMNGHAADCTIIIMGEMLQALQLAQHALNTAPRFKIAHLPREHNDSYKVASVVDAAVRRAQAC
jgi:hypothetical protein